MSMVRLLDIEDTILTICDLDILDGTPVLDIKPYCGENQSLDQLKTGWMEK
jgi:tRNA (Thr-GGU) A37 N-methylase